jgi:hypothetical protein
MEFESPIRTSNYNLSIKVKILNKLILDIESSNSKISPENHILELKEYLIPIADEFEKYSLKWMPSRIDSTYFLSNIVHEWKCSISDVSTDTNINTFRQFWELEEIKIIRDQYILHWNLYYVEPISLADSSGQNDVNTIPYFDDAPLTIFKNPRARIREKIRRARIRVTALKLKLHEMTDAYYTKYGLFEGTKKESDLSSEIDSNIE